MPRKSCQTCHRPPSVCYCSALVRLNNHIKVLIIQHPLEVKHPFNTGRMAHLCLSNSELIVAEVLSASTLEKILSIPSLLLYPTLPWLPETAKFESHTALEKSSINFQQLIVIDATWRKSKKILHLHPGLQNLPRLSLTGYLQSHYQIRKTSMADGLSTIESLAKALQIIEPDNDFQSMLNPFDKMIALQQSNRVG